MATTRIKICGITSTVDAEVVVDAVDLARAVDVAAAVPPFVSVVALFVDATAAQVEAVLEAVPVDLLQFHGDESPEFCRSFARPFLKALRMQPGADPAATALAYRGCRGLLLDSWQEGVPGGTDTPLVLAGGLNAGNVGRAIALVRPAAVDVSGGVEVEPGVKDRRRIEAFVAAVRRADGAAS